MKICEEHEDCVVISDVGRFQTCPVCQMQKQLDEAIAMADMLQGADEALEAERSRTADCMQELRDAQNALAEKQAECEKLRAECESLRERGLADSLDTLNSARL